MSALRDFQARFARAVTAPAPPGGAAPLGVAALFSGAPARAEAALAVYRNNYFHGFTRALHDAYPVAAQLVGEDFFRAAARAFLLAHPPRERWLTTFGAGFAGFLEDFAPAARLPYLADLARLEYARLCALHAADAAPLDPHVLRSLAPADFAALRLPLHPSARLLDLNWPADQIWQAHQPPATPDNLQVAPTRLNILVVRPRRAVVMQRLAPPLAALAAAAARGATLGEAAGSVLEAGTACDLTSVMRQALALQIFADPGVPSHTKPKESKP